MEAENTAFWDRMSPLYDRVTENAAYARMIDRAAREVSGDVLEVATGTGAIASAAATAGARVQAVDISAKMLERARARCADVTFSCQSAYALEFADESFDGLICANALHCMRTPRRALAEFHRVLRPGGILVAPTYCAGFNRRTRLRTALMSLTGFRVYHKLNPRTLGALISSAGFAVRTVEPDDQPIPLAYLVAVKPPA